MSLFERLCEACAPEWRDYTQHKFVQGLGDGSLPHHCFRYYLMQDYLFLIHFARAYALGVYKSRTLLQMEESAGALQAIFTEMNLHIEYCAQWGIAKEQLEQTPEDPANMAYTRYVLECGVSGDLLDLHTALSPCVIGYARIGTALAATPRDDNPYQRWIDEYAGEAFQGVAQAAEERLDRLAESYMTEARFPFLQQVFSQACRLETGFWQMGLDAPQQD